MMALVVVVAAAEEMVVMARRLELLIFVLKRGKSDVG